MYPYNPYNQYYYNPYLYNLYFDEPYFTVSSCVPPAPVSTPILHPPTCPGGVLTTSPGPATTFTTSPGPATTFTTSPGPTTTFTTSPGPFVPTTPALPTVPFKPINRTINATFPDPTKYYRLSTLFLESRNMCLESNDPNSPVKSGAVFMAPCRNVQGQLWKFSPVSDGYFTITSRFLENRARCLDANPVAIMNLCNRSASQFWKLVDAGGNRFKLQNRRDGDSKCLEGNHPDSLVNNGAAFMDNCSSVTGQAWSIGLVE